MQVSFETAREFRGLVYVVGAREECSVSQPAVPSTRPRLSVPLRTECGIRVRETVGSPTPLSRCQDDGVSVTLNVSINLLAEEQQEFSLECVPEPNITRSDPVRGLALPPQLGMTVVRGGAQGQSAADTLEVGEPFSLVWQFVEEPGKAVRPRSCQASTASGSGSASRRATDGA